MVFIERRRPTGLQSQHRHVRRRARVKLARQLSARPPLLGVQQLVEGRDALVVDLLVVEGRAVLRLGAELCADALRRRVLLDW